MYYGYIYKTTNLINSKIYIGQRKGKFNPKYLGSGVYIKRAINKYGKENFSVEVLCICETLEGTNEAEVQYIAEYNSMNKTIGYNLCKGGQGTSGYKQTPDSSKKRWETIKNKTKEELEEISLKKSKSMIGKNKGTKNGMYGKKLSEENRKKLRKAHLGRKHSEESLNKMREVQSNRGDSWKKNISEAKKGYKNGMYGKTAPNAKKIYYNKTDKVYSSLKECSKEIGKGFCFIKRRLNDPLIDKENIFEYR